MYRRYVHQRLKESLRKHNDGHYQWAKKFRKVSKKGWFSRRLENVWTGNVNVCGHGCVTTLQSLVEMDSGWMAKGDGCEPEGERWSQ